MAGFAVKSSEFFLLAPLSFQLQLGEELGLAGHLEFKLASHNTIQELVAGDIEGRAGRGDSMVNDMALVVEVYGFEYWFVGEHWLKFVVSHSNSPQRRRPVVGDPEAEKTKNAARMWHPASYPRQSQLLGYWLILLCSWISGGSYGFWTPTTIRLDAAFLWPYLFH